MRVQLNLRGFAVQTQHCWHSWFHLIFHTKALACGRTLRQIQWQRKRVEESGVVCDCRNMDRYACLAFKPFTFICFSIISWSRLRDYPSWDFCWSQKGVIKTSGSKHGIVWLIPCLEFWSSQECILPWNLHRHPKTLPVMDGWFDFHIIFTNWENWTTLLRC